MHLVGDGLSVQQNILPRIASGSNEVFLLSRWGIWDVFLLSRIRERYNRTGDNTEAVAYGVRSTAGIITGAALIMVAVFGGFAMGELVMFQQVGFGLAVAVFLDATVVRSVLVPATMQLLGTRNWYLPSVLSWLPEIRIESTEPAVAPADGGD